MSNSLFTCQSLHIDMEKHSKLTGKNPEINYSARTPVERWSGAKVIFYKAIFSLLTLWFVSSAMALYKTLG